MPTPSIFRSATEEQLQRLRDLAEKHGLTVDSYYIGPKGECREQLIFEAPERELIEIEKIAVSMGLHKASLVRFAVRAMMAEIKGEAHGREGREPHRAPQG
jgi:hypothetical protein